MLVRIEIENSKGFANKIRAIAKPETAEAFEALAVQLEKIAPANYAASAFIPLLAGAFRKACEPETVPRSQVYALQMHLGKIVDALVPHPETAEAVEGNLMSLLRDLFNPKFEEGTETLLHGQA